MKDKYRKAWIIFFSVVFISGFVSGSLIQKNDSVNKAISNISLNLISTRKYGETLNVFMNSLFLNFVVMLLILAFNRSKLCALFKAVVLFLNGVGKGAVTANIVCEYGIHGLVVSTVVILPGMITATCAAILLAAQSLNYVSRENNKIVFKQRFYTLLIYFILIFFSAGLDVSFAKIGKTLL